MAAVNPGVWGIDIGQCALKALRLEQINGVVTATAFDYVEHPKILSQPDANPDELTREALEKFLSRNPTKGDKIAMSVPGQSGLARFVKLPPVEEKKIGDIVKFEAKQQIPFPLDEVVWDYQKVSEGTVTDGFAMDTEIGLFAMKRDMISRFIGHFQSVKLEVHQVQMTPLALANYITFDLLKRGGIDGETAPAQTVGKKKCVVALDIGTDASNLIITDGARIIWQRPIPVGGNHFTRALTKELKLTFAKAEHLKRNAAKSPELANILKALRPVLQEFVGEVQRSLGYFTNTHRDAQVEFMVGLGSAFKLPGLQKFLADKLSLEVRKADKFQRVTGEAVTDAPVFKENLLSFPVAYGLALQGLGIARIATNLLPPEITFERKIRAKKPYAVAAAAALLFGTTVLAYGYSIPLADVSDQKIATALNSAKGVVTQAQTLDKQIADKKTEIEKTQIEVESIIAGQGERKNWIAIDRFINESVPVPGPASEKAVPIPGYHNMVSPQLEPYWNTVQGRRAIIKLQERVARGVDPTAPTEEDFRDHLATIDIEAVYCRHTKNLKDVYSKIETKWRAEIDGPRSFIGSELAPDQWWEKKPDRTMPPPSNVREELKPEGEGWVFEVRGSTYWHPTQTSSTPKFIVDTLVNNIITRSRDYTEEQKKNMSEEQKKLIAMDPIQGKISHVFLYHVWPDANPSPGNFQIIKNTLLDAMISDETGGTGGEMGPSGPGPGPMGAGPHGPSGPPIVGGPAASSSSSGAAGGAGGWRPLGSFAAQGSIGASGGATGGAAFGGPAASSSGPLTPSVTTPPATTEGPKGAVKIKPRYEFVVIFAWKEPTPSDKLRVIKNKEAAAAAGGPAAVGAPPGVGTPGRGGPSGAPMSTPPPSSGSESGGGAARKEKIED
ncbi:MAG TPA: type IV pilus assembly protein PilM [Gemmataceae bacterium]|jgi:type IV pilus assembly protein PilM|nr:type IV pilus assembly protein PilM [Gemmataceae bacterium]